MSGFIIYVGAYAKEIFKTKAVIAKYGFDNEKLERILDNAVTYVEGYSKTVAKDTATRLSSSHKLDMANSLIL